MTIPDEVDIIVCGGKQAFSKAAAMENTDKAAKGALQDASLQVVWLRSIET